MSILRVAGQATMEALQLPEHLDMKRRFSKA
jgi:hypothetical protein